MENKAITEKIIKNLLNQRARLIDASVQINHSDLNGFNEKQNIDEKIAEIDMQISIYATK